MKKIWLIPLIVFAGVFSSCESDKNMYNPDKEENVGDLIVPGNFDWKTTRAVACNIQSSVPTVIYIYNNEACKEEGLVAIYHLFPGMSNSFSLNLATHLNEVYLQYSDVKVAVNIENGILNYTVPETGEKAAKAIVPCNNSGCEEKDIIYFPCEGDWATVLYEDLFPEQGDYDFNDVVLNYKRTYYLNPTTKRLEKIDLEMRVNALGGTLNYYPCFRIDGVAHEKVWRIATMAQNEFTYIELDDDPDKDSDTTYKILYATEKPAGCQFLNTSPDEEKRPQPELEHFKIVIEFFPDNMPTLGELSSFDIFIYNDKQEIHEKGGEPAWTDYPKFSDQGSYNYSNKRNLVWGLTIPTEIKHAKERANFLKAYPLFELWATSGGAKNHNWYSENDADKNYLFTIPQN